jgi:hypothetical protein
LPTSSEVVRPASAGHRTEATSGNVVTVELRGRLGNHLFEFAAGLRLADLHRSELVIFDPLDVARSSAGIARVLRQPYRFAQPSEMLRYGRLLYDMPLRNTLSGVLGRSMEPRLRRGAGRNVVREEDLGAQFRFHPEILEFFPPMLLSGYFQNEGYFAPVTSSLLDAVALPPVARLLPGRGGPTIAVVFRRGDYVDFGWALPLRYYEAALDHLASLVPEATVLVFSDDAEFAELAGLWIGRRYGHDVVVASGLTTDACEQLALIEQCHHHVLANSTFSWWGAWLAEHRAPTLRHHILAPAGWVSGDDSLIPERWVLTPF